MGTVEGVYAFGQRGWKPLIHIIIEMQRRPWTSADVPPGPYFHGTRRTYAPGDQLLTDVVNNQPGEEDDRQMCWACLDAEVALDWAYSRGIGKGPILYAYEVELLDPEVDINMHPLGTDEEIISVMSPQGRVIRVAREVPVADFDRTPFGKT